MPIIGTSKMAVKGAMAPRGRLLFSRIHLIPANSFKDSWWELNGGELLLVGIKCGGQGGGMLPDMRIGYDGKVVKSIVGQLMGVFTRPH
jgi:hypothetical protein